MIQSEYNERFSPSRKICDIDRPVKECQANKSHPRHEYAESARPDALVYRQPAIEYVTGDEQNQAGFYRLEPGWPAMP